LTLAGSPQSAIPEEPKVNLETLGSRIEIREHPEQDRTMIKVATNLPTWSSADGIGWRNCQIAWEENVNSNSDERTTHFFSMLPYGWVPANDFDFLDLFFSHLQDSWERACKNIENHLSKKASSIP